MTPEYFATLLDGRQFDNVLSMAERQAMVNAGVAVVYGLEDETIRFDGAIMSMGYPGYNYLHNRQVIELEEAFASIEEQMIFLKRYGAHVNSFVRGTYFSDTEFKWSITCNFPYVEFSTFKQDHKYCKAIAFSVENMQEQELDWCPGFVRLPTKDRYRFVSVSDIVGFNYDDNNPSYCKVEIRNDDVLTTLYCSEIMLLTAITKAKAIQVYGEIGTTNQ